MNLVMELEDELEVGVLTQGSAEVPRGVNAEKFTMW